MTADVTSCRALPDESAVLRYLLQYATLTGRDALGRSTEAAEDSRFIEEDLGGGVAAEAYRKAAPGRIKTVE